MAFLPTLVTVSLCLILTTPSLSTSPPNIAAIRAQHEALLSERDLLMNVLGAAEQDLANAHDSYNFLMNQRNKIQAVCKDLNSCKSISRLVRTIRVVRKKCSKTRRNRAKRCRKTLKMLLARLRRSKKICRRISGQKGRKARRSLTKRCAQLKGAQRDVKDSYQEIVQAKAMVQEVHREIARLDATLASVENRLRKYGMFAPKPSINPRPSIEPRLV